MKISDSDHESSRRTSPRPFDGKNCHYQTALFMGGSHWAAASACGDSKQENVQQLDNTLTAVPFDDGDFESNDPGESNSVIEAEVICVKTVKVLKKHDF